MTSSSSSDSEIAERVKQILSTADLATATIKGIRCKLEEDLGVDLSHKKAFIREQVDLFIANAYAQNQNQNEQQQQDQKQQQRHSASPENANEAEEEEQDSASDKGGSTGRSNKEKSSKQTGFTKLCGLSPELQSLLGVDELPRTQVVKQIWAYIREKNLQDPENRRRIVCDDKLRQVFKKDKVDMFEMNKVLSSHLFPSNNANVFLAGMEDIRPKAKHERQESEEGSQDSGPKSKRQKPEKKDGNKGKSGFCSPLPLSDALVNFLSTGETELSRSEVVKRIWDYIKAHKLQDPTDKRKIICDEKLRELFGCETFNGFGVTKLLSAHFLKS